MKRWWFLNWSNDWNLENKWMNPNDYVSQIYLINWSPVCVGGEWRSRLTPTFTDHVDGGIYRAKEEVSFVLLCVCMVP
jgi:hypothetical protein